MSKFSKNLKREMALTYEEKRKMITAGIEKTVPLKKLARDYHYDLKTLKRYVARAEIHGIDAVFASYPKKISKEEKLEAVRLLRTGVSQNQIAILYNVEHSSVRDWLRLYGKGKRAKKSPSK